MIDEVMMRYYGAGAGGHYEVHIRPGRLSAEGEHPALGVRGYMEKPLPPGEAEAMFYRLLRAGYREWETRYMAGATDIPSFELAIRTRDGVRIVRCDQGEGPQALREAFRRIERLVRAAAMVGGGALDCCSVSECAAFLGVGEEAVVEWIRQGRLEAFIAEESGTGTYRLPRGQFRYLIAGRKRHGLRGMG